MLNFLVIFGIGFVVGFLLGKIWRLRDGVQAMSRISTYPFDKFSLQK